MYLKGIPGDQGLAGPAGGKVSLLVHTVVFQSMCSATKCFHIHCEHNILVFEDTILTASTCFSRESVVTLVLQELLDLRDQLDPVDLLEHLDLMVAR